MKSISVQFIGGPYDGAEFKTKSPLCDPKTAMPYLVIESQALKIEIPKD